MNLFFLRHGEASTHSTSDEKRELTKLGRVETKKMMSWFLKQKIKIQLIVSSPYVRACQTAEIAQKILKIKENILTTKNITPESKAEDILPILEAIEVENVLLVTHMPFVLEAISKLVYGDSSAKILMPTSSLTYLMLNKIEFGKAQLVWSENPGSLKK